MIACILLYSSMLIGVHFLVGCDLHLMYSVQCFLKSDTWLLKNLLPCQGGSYEIILILIDCTFIPEFTGVVDIIWFRRCSQNFGAHLGGAPCISLCSGVSDVLFDQRIFEFTPHLSYLQCVFKVRNS